MEKSKLDFNRLKQNILDVIKEQQVKLGYRKEVIRLYYPLLSLNRLLKSQLDTQAMEKALEDFCKETKDVFGETKISHEDQRFCFCFSPEASEYVYKNTDREGFLYDFIETVSRHKVTIQEVVDQFRKYSDQVQVERANHGDFDYLVYFKDGVPDSFRYCLTDEGCHVIYHRFTEEDYEDFHFGE